MKPTRTTHFAAVILTLGLLALSSTAQAVTSRLIGPSTNLQLGLWQGTLKQAGFGNESKIESPLSLGASLGLGAIFADLIFLQYRFTYLHDFQSKMNSSYYYSLGGLDLGIDVPIIPIQLYVGGELGRVRFPLAGMTYPSAKTLKLGAEFTFLRRGPLHLGLRAEWRRIYLGYDQEGEIPEAYSTQDDALFGSISFGI